LAALAFRKGYLAVVVICILPLPQPAEAVSWESLWRNDNQRASEQLQQGKNQQAAELFTDPEWKAAAHYKAGNYEQALQQLEAIDHAEAHYNRGNALAKLGRFAEALEAYQQALEQNPQHADAQHNKQLLEQQQQNQQQQQGQGQDKNQDSQTSQDSSQNDSTSDSSTESQPNPSATQQQNDQQDSSNDSQPTSSEQSAEQQAEDAKQSQKAETETNDQATDDQAAQQQTTTSPSSQALSEQAKQQWLRRIPDDPGGLLRNKFHYQYKQQPYKSDDSQEW
jgi:Ca-activated chloride channel family protein